MAPAEWEMIGQLFLAAILAGVLGWERQHRGQAAGLRTYMLVAIAAAAFTQVGAYAFLEPDSPRDPTRVAAQVVTGVGFLGAGAIWRSGVGPRGLTTAAGLWVSAALGLFAAAGLYHLAVAVTILAWLILRGGIVLEQHLGLRGSTSRENHGDHPEDERST